MITLTGIENNILTAFIASKKKPPGIPLAKWGTCLLSLTNLPDSQVAEALGKSTGAIRSIRYRNKNLTTELTAEFVDHFIVAAERAFSASYGLMQAWQRDCSKPRPNLWRAALSIGDLASPVVAAAIFETLQARGLKQLYIYVPMSYEGSAAILKTYRTALFESVKDFIENGGDKGLALSALTVLREMGG